jgi:glutathione S-transferase
MPSYYTIFAFAFGFGGPFNQEAFDKALENYSTFIKNAEKQLGHGKKFLLGDEVTLVDIIIGCTFIWPLGLSLDKEYREKHSTFFGYLKNFYEQEEVKSVVGEIKFAEKFEASNFIKKE